MSFALIGKVWSLSLESPTQKLILLALADYGIESWPSIPTIARKCQLCERTVYQELAKLKSKKLLEVISGGPGKSNRYRILLTPAPDAPLNNVHPCTRFSEPLHHMQKTPAPRSPYPSVNPKEPKRGKAPQKFISELQTQIQSAEDEIQRIKDFGSDEERKQIPVLRGRQKQWKAEMLSQ